MNELDFEETIIEEPEIDIEPVYNQHFIEMDENGNIIKGWSDAFAPATENSIVINSEPFPKKWTEKLLKKRNKNKPKMSKVI